MGIRKSTVKNKKSKTAAARNTVNRDAARRQVNRGDSRERGR